MKNITSGGVLARVSRFVPQDAIPPYRTVAEWREWQLAEGRKRSEEVNRLNHQTRVEKIINRSGIQPLHRKCTFGNYRVQNDGQRHALSQAKSIAAELEGGCTNFVFSGRPGGGYWQPPSGERSQCDCDNSGGCDAGVTWQLRQQKLGRKIFAGIVWR